MKEITKKEIQRVFDEIFSNFFTEIERKMFNYCKQKYTLVDRSILNLNICNDTECLSCRQIEGCLKEEAKKYDH